MGDRWLLNRAGILNVYQYSDETLTFTGGDSHRSPPTPWDFGLQLIFDEHRLIVHEERLISSLLGG